MRILPEHITLLYIRRSQILCESQYAQSDELSEMQIGLFHKLSKKYACVVKMVFYIWGMNTDRIMFFTLCPSSLNVLSLVSICLPVCRWYVKLQVVCVCLLTVRSVWLLSVLIWSPQRLMSCVRLKEDSRVKEEMLMFPFFFFFVQQLNGF